MESKEGRREFMKGSAGVGLSLACTELLAQTAPRTQDSAEHSKPRDSVRVGFVGVGVKGSAHLGNLLGMEHVEVRAVCDIVERQCAEAQQQADRLGKPIPNAYTRGPRDYERLCEEEELDLVYTATPWRWHAPVCLAAMKGGAHAATEIPAALTLDECWRLVETSEKTGRYCVMMENVNYMRNEMAVLNMVRKGLLGEIVHGEGSYLHDTRHLKINDFGDGLWLGDHHATRNGNLYPTHGLGPMAWYMDINRGDRFDYLVSMSSNARGMDLYAREHLPENHPKRTRKYINGDVNTCLIHTVNGRSIVLKHDTDLPRPYSRTNLVQGTRGVARCFPEFVVSIEGETHQHKWRPGNGMLDEYDHPLWKQMETSGIWNPRKAPSTEPIIDGAVWHYDSARELRNADFVEDYRLIEAIRGGVAPDTDVYDAAAWSVVADLSEQSVADRSRAIDFPDFTKGAWKTKEPVRIMGV